MADENDIIGSASEFIKGEIICVGVNIPFPSALSIQFSILLYDNFATWVMSHMSQVWKACVYICVCVPPEQEYLTKFYDVRLMDGNSVQSGKVNFLNLKLGDKHTLADPVRDLGLQW